MDRKISIIIPIYNISDEIERLTHVCLRSLKDTTTDYELILIDNGNGEKWKDWADVYIKNDINNGNGAAWTQGAKAAKYDYILFANNDVEFSEGWKDALIEPFEKDEKIGATFPKTINYAQEKEANCKLSGFFWVTKKKYVEEIGYFDPFYFPGNFEDSSFFKELQLRGKELVCVSSITIRHRGRATCSIVPEIEERYRIHEDYYFKKYSILPFLNRII